MYYILEVYLEAGQGSRGGRGPEVALLQGQLSQLRPLPQQLVARVLERGAVAPHGCDRGELGLHPLHLQTNICLKKYLP